MKFRNDNYNNFVKAVREGKSYNHRKNYFKVVIDKLNKNKSTSVDRFLPLYLLEMDSINKYLSQIKLGFYDYKGISPLSKKMVRNVVLKRVFNRGEGGRLYGYGLCYQNIKREERAYLTINDKPTKECDYNALHINLIYANERLKNPYYDTDSFMPIVRDLIHKEDKELRDVVKYIIMIMINASSLLSAEYAFKNPSSEEITKIEEKNEHIEVLKKHNLSFSQVIQSFKKIHPSISEFMNTGVANQLMFQDSNILIKTLEKIKEENILGIPLHDSIITQAHNANRVTNIMKTIYKDTTGNEIIVKIKNT